LPSTSPLSPAKTDLSSLFPVCSEAVGAAGADGALIGAIDENGQVKQEYLERWGLKPEDAATIRGPGDQKVLDAIKTLFDLKKQGLIKAVGMSGASSSASSPFLP
jgi:hypothetical protein